MNKLNLKLDDLAVESFSTRAESGARGTVRGNDATDNWGSQCCWVSDTQCGGTYNGDTYCCGGGGNPNSGAPSCGNTCRITGNWKCADGCGTTD